MAALYHNSPLLRSTFDPYWLKNDSLLNRRHFDENGILRVATPEMALGQHMQRRSVAATIDHQSSFYNLPLTQILAKLVEK